MASGVVAITAGPYNTFFIKDDGSLWGMGNGNDGWKIGGRDFPIKLHDFRRGFGKYWQASFIHD